MNISILDIEDQLLITLALVDFESAKRILPEHPIFLDRKGGLVVSWVGGSCPTRSEGEMWGERYYFSARHGDWCLNIGEAPVFNPVMQLSGKDDTAGFMSDARVMRILRSAATMVGYLKMRGAWGTDADPSDEV